MPKLNINDLYNGRLEQIEKDLKKEYYKGHRKSRMKIALLLQEKSRIKIEMEGEHGSMETSL